jgi:hypothetical protein
VTRPDGSPGRVRPGPPRPTAARRGVRRSLAGSGRPGRSGHQRKYSLTVSSNLRMAPRQGPRHDARARDAPSASRRCAHPRHHRRVGSGEARQAGVRCVEAERAVGRQRQRCLADAERARRGEGSRPSRAIFATVSPWTTTVPATERDCAACASGGATTPPSSVHAMAATPPPITGLVERILLATLPPSSSQKDRR